MSRKQEACLIRQSVTLYKALLGLYPKGYRSEYGEPMVQIFRDLANEGVAEKGGLALGRLWRVVLWDTIVALSQEYSELIRKDVMKQANTNYLLAWILGGLLLLPATLLLIMWTLFVRLWPNQTVLTQLYTSPIYRPVILHLILFIAPLVAIGLNVFPLLTPLRRQGSYLTASYVKSNAISIGLVGLGVAFIGLLFLRDTVGCALQAFTHGVPWAIQCIKSH